MSQNGWDKRSADQGRDSLGYLIMVVMNAMQTRLRYLGLSQNGWAQQTKTETVSECLKIVEMNAQQTKIESRDVLE